MCKRTLCFARSIVVEGFGDGGPWLDAESGIVERLCEPCKDDVEVVTRTNCLAPPPYTAPHIISEGCNPANLVTIIIIFFHI